MHHCNDALKNFAISNDSERSYTAYLSAAEDFSFVEMTILLVFNPGSCVSPLILPCTQHHQRTRRQCFNTLLSRHSAQLSIFGTGIKDDPFGVSCQYIII
jgi:hypothetical protein